MARLSLPVRLPKLIVMRKVNLDHVKELERQSPKGKYHSHYKEISIALGRERDSLDLAKRHPFDLMLTRIPPGASFCPYHSESAQFEFYLVVSGRGRCATKAARAKSARATPFSSLQAKRIRRATTATKISFITSSRTIQSATRATTPTVRNGRSRDRRITLL